jgi:hypothetical protein
LRSPEARHSPTSQTSSPGRWRLLPLPEAMRDLVTGPLGLADTGFALTDPSRLATAYADAVPRPRRMREPDRLPLEHFRFNRGHSQRR